MSTYKWLLLGVLASGILVFVFKFNLDGVMNNENDAAFFKIKQINSNYSEQDLKFIESALIQGKVIISLKDLVASHLRLFIEEQNETNYFIHIGAENPGRGGSGSTYSVNKSTGEVKLISNETYAPDPHSGFNE